MIELKTPREIEEMKPPAALVGGILKELQGDHQGWAPICSKSTSSSKKIVDRKGAESLC